MPRFPKDSPEERRDRMATTADRFLEQVAVTPADEVSEEDVKPSEPEPSTINKD